ncbi:MAG TPA: hypothetical protein VF062_02245 [Candidatus Limnocylindrales bacterium]
MVPLLLVATLTLLGPGTPAQASPSASATTGFRIDRPEGHGRYVQSGRLARVRMAGVSYGAGIGLLASAVDGRVRAVAALSGWSDLVGSLFGGDTRRLQSSPLLAGSAQLLGRPSDELNAMLADFYAYRNVEGIKAFGRIRSAATYLNAINANRPAILMANAYGDSISRPTS